MKLFLKIIWPLYKKYIYKRGQIVGDQFINFIKDGDAVLDFGGGIMLASKYIASKKNISLTGIDIKEYKSFKKRNVKFIKYSGGKIPIKNNTYDVVIALFVLHHTNNPEFYLRELIRISKKTIILCEDTYSNRFEKEITKIICIFANFISGDTDMRRSFKSIDEWVELFNKNNLKLVNSNRFYPYLIKGIPTKNISFVLEKQK